MCMTIHKKTADIQLSSGGVVRETARAAERVAIDYHQECPPWDADLQGSRNQCTNNKVNKSYEHGSAPSFVLSSCHEALVKLLAGRLLGCDWALLRFAPREVCRLIKLCLTCHCDYFVS